MQAAAWGLAGGLAVEVGSFIAAVKANDYRWPWRVDGGAVDPGFDLWPRVLVMLGALLLGALVASAAHSQMSGGWPAFIMGVGAPSTVRGALGGVEVREQVGARLREDATDEAAQ